MNGLNKVYLIGYVGRDPEVRSTPGGKTMVKLSVATPCKKKVGDEWVDTPDWHRLTAWEKTAEYIAKYINKGDAIAVECAIKPSKWTDRDGKIHYETNIVVERVLYTAKKAQRTPFGQAPAATEPPELAGGAVVPEADLPPMPDDEDYLVPAKEDG